MDITTDNYQLAKQHYDKATFRLNNEDYNGAISEYKEALILCPNYLEANNDIGVVYLKLEDFTNAHFYFDIALKINPEYELSIKNKAVVFYSQATKKLNTNDYQAAIADYMEALILYPEYFEAYNDIGFAYLKLEDFTIAHSYFDIALQINPSYELSKHNKGLAFYSQATTKINNGDIQGAIDDYLATLSFYPNYLDAFNSISNAYLELGDSIMSQYYFDKGLELKDDLSKKNQANEYYNKGTQELKLQRYKKAISYYTKAITIYNKYEEAYVNRGVSYFYSRKYKKAMQDYDMALNINPNDRDAQINKELLVGWNYQRNINSINKINAITDGLNSFNNSLIAINNTNSDNQNLSSVPANTIINANNSSKCNIYQQQYDIQKNNAHAELSSINVLNANDYVKSEIGDLSGHQINPALNYSKVGSLQSIQKYMRTIREMAKKKGCIISKAYEEDCTPQRF